MMAPESERANVKSDIGGENFSTIENNLPVGNSSKCGNCGKSFTCDPLEHVNECEPTLTCSEVVERLANNPPTTMRLSSILISRCIAKASLMVYTMRWLFLIPSFRRGMVPTTYHPESSKRGKVSVFRKRGCDD